MKGKLSPSCFFKIRLRQQQTSIASASQQHASLHTLATSSQTSISSYTRSYDSLSYSRRYIMTPVSKSIHSIRSTLARRHISTSLSKQSQSTGENLRRPSQPSTRKMHTSSASGYQGMNVGHNIPSSQWTSQLHAQQTIRVQGFSSHASTKNAMITNHKRFNNLFLSRANPNLTVSSRTPSARGISSYHTKAQATQAARAATSPQTLINRLSLPSALRSKSSMTTQSSVHRARASHNSTIARSLSTSTGDKTPSQPATAAPVKKKRGIIRRFFGMIGRAIKWMVILGVLYGSGTLAWEALQMKIQPYLTTHYFPEDLSSEEPGYIDMFRNASIEQSFQMLQIGDMYRMNPEMIPPEMVEMIKMNPKLLEPFTGADFETISTALDIANGTLGFTDRITLFGRFRSLFLYYQHSLGRPQVAGPQQTLYDFLEPHFSGTQDQFIKYNIFQQYEMQTKKALPLLHLELNKHITSQLVFKQQEQSYLNQAFQYVMGGPARTNTSSNIQNIKAMIDTLTGDVPLHSALRERKRFLQDVFDTERIPNEVVASSLHYRIQTGRLEALLSVLETLKDYEHNIRYLPGRLEKYSSNGARLMTLDEVTDIITYTSEKVRGLEKLVEKYSPNEFDAIQRFILDPSHPLNKSYGMTELQQSGQTTLPGPSGGSMLVMTQEEGSTAVDIRQTQQTLGAIPSTTTTTV